jgi:hypothetical protein
VLLNKNVNKEIIKFKLAISNNSCNSGGGSSCDNSICDDGVVGNSRLIFSFGEEIYTYVQSLSALNLWSPVQ